MTDPVPCPECGSRPHANDRYCPECGAQLPSARAEAGDGASGEAQASAVARTVAADAAIAADDARLNDGAAVGAGDRPNATAADSAGEAAGHDAGGADGAPPAAPLPYGTWSPHVARGSAPDRGAASGVAAAGTSTEPLPTAHRAAGRAPGGATEPGPRGASAEPDAPAAVDRPISPAAAAAAAAAVAAADNRAPVNAGRSPDANGEDAGWFGATSAGSMLALGLLLVAVGILLVLVGKIDRTGTIGIVGLLIAVGGAFMIPLAAVRAIADRVL